MKIKYLVYTLTLIMALYSCSNESQEELRAQALADLDLPTGEEEEGEPGEENGNETNLITYDGEIRDIMLNNCNRCHTIPLAFGAPFPLLTFNDVSSRANRIIARMNDGSNPMPPSGLLPLNIRVVVEQWREDGLLEN